MVGAELPPGEDGKPFKIKVGKLRGVESEGMLCSAKELKIADDHGGLLELTNDAPLGQNIREHLHLDDTLFTLKLTPNLAHCLSVFGIARELSALTGAPLKTPLFPKIQTTHTDTLPVKIDAFDLCGRFSGRIVRGVNPKATTPAWMVDRLARCGQRSVSPLVDSSNYVMFELGRPSHIFDLDKIHGGLDVRWGRADEQLKLLNGQTVTLDTQVGVIADDHAVESLAGIMGGQATAVSDSTSNIYIEAAFWWPTAIAGRSRRFNFSTDAGHRFERGVDPQLTVEHIERITQLVVDICGTPQTTIGPIDDQQVNIPKSEPVTLRVARAVKVIGMPLTQQRIADALRGLGITDSSAPVTSVTVDGRTCEQKFLGNGAPSGASQDLSGADLGSAEYSGSFGAEFVQPIGAMAWFTQLDVNFTDDYFMTGDLDPIDVQAGFEAVNIRTGLRGDSWMLMFYGRNIGNEVYATGAFDIPLASGSHGRYQARGEVWGVQAAWEF